MLQQQWYSDLCQEYKWQHAESKQDFTPLLWNGSFQIWNIAKYCVIHVIYVYPSMNPSIHADIIDVHVKDVIYYKKKYIFIFLYIFFYIMYIYKFDYISVRESHSGGFVFFNI